MEGVGGKYRIDARTVDEVLDRAEIVDVVSDFVSLHRRGQNYIGLCPFHQDRNPSFYVSPSKNICKCFSCGEGGSPLNFIMKHEQLSWVDAIRYLAKKYGIEIVERELSAEELEARNEREALFMANSFARDLFVRELFEVQEGRTIGLSYFRERGFHEEVLKAFQIGFSPDKQGYLHSEAMKKGLKEESLIKAGLITKGEDGRIWERFQGRIIFPIHTLSGGVVGFGGRILKPSQKAAKYVNSPETDIYSKGDELYGLFQAKQEIGKQDKCFIVEGYMDVLALHQAGIKHVVASSGTALTESQVRKIKRFTHNITLFFDGDAPGLKAALRGIDVGLEQGLNVKILTLPPEHDPDTFVKEKTPEEFYAYVNANEQDFVSFKSDVLMRNKGQDVQARVQMTSSILSSIALIPDELTREFYIKEAVAHTGISEEVAFSSISEKRSERQKHSEQSLSRIEQEAETPTTEGQTERLVQTPAKDHNLKPGEFALLHALLKDIFTILDPIKFETESGELYSPAVFELVEGELSELEDTGFFSEAFTRFYRLLYKEMIPNMDKEQIYKQLLSHPEDGIRLLGTRIITDERPLSAIHGGEKDKTEEAHKLVTAVYKLILNLKFNYVREKIDHLMESLKEPDEENIERRTEILKEIQRWTAIRNNMANRLGERVLIPNNIILK